jgi:uncharacterized protein YndB with AHSA1/START domain
VADQPGLDMTWTFDAPREEVWREWTEPSRFADWYGGPSFDVPLETMSWDLREGGKLSFVMKGDGREIHWDGEFLEVDEPERLVFTINDRPGRDAYERCTVVLTDLGDGRTEMRFSQRGQLPPEMYERTERGWSGFFTRIAERLASDESGADGPS